MDGFTDGDIEGCRFVGVPEGLPVGLLVGLVEGSMVGDEDGARDVGSAGVPTEI